MANREFDIVLYGATGFTGRLVAEYLATAAPAGVRIALAGRSADRLREVQRTLPGEAQRWPLIEANANDPSSLAAMAERARVVCTTVGPYAKFGLPLVAACAAAGTHYCDLTGEVPFIRDAIDRHHDQAQTTGARIVNCCGFDSIPSDLGVLLLHRELGALTAATYVVESISGGFSGGTLASMLNLLDEARRDRSRRKLVVDPYALSPDRSKEPELGDERDLMKIDFDRLANRKVGPFVMAAVNTRVVRRSNALQEYAYGRRLRYREVTALPGGLKGTAVGIALTGGLGLFLAGASFAPTRKLIERALPKPGEGPSEKARRKGHMRIRLFGEGENGRRASVRVEGQGDPGYALTSVMLGEAALCLALDEPRLPSRSGVLTPSTAMGMTLVERLRSAGLTFVTDSD